MTALTTPARPAHPETLRPVPWRQLAWVTWRRNRAALAGVGALFGASALYLLITGLKMRQDYAPVGACHPARADVCRQAANDFLNAHGFDKGITAALLHTLPVLIGAFAGAPILARELETGTFRFTWTQGAGRVRWTAAMLVPLAVTATAAAAAFGLLVSWWVQPLFDAGGWSPLHPAIFDLRGIAFPAWTLAAFAIGALAGILLRRVVLALTATLAAWTGLAFTAGTYLRQHYQAPLITSDANIGHPAWVLNQAWTQHGHPVSLATLNQALQPDGVIAITPNRWQPFGLGGGIDPVQYLTQHGFAQLTTYQPVSRYWPFQWIEAGWLVALSLLLLAATFWLVHRRAS